MRMLDLFSGIGGFSLAAQWVWGDDLEIVAFCEIDPFCQRVFRKHWPGVQIIEDIKKVEWVVADTSSNGCNGYSKREPRGKVKEGWMCQSRTEITVSSIDLLTGGFPCQPFSCAGKRAGTEDDRFLWPEMLRAIHEVKPRWVVAENVPGILSLDGGMVFEGVCSDLEAEGYEVIPFVIPACAVGAPHRRDRVWIVGHSNTKGLQGYRQYGEHSRKRFIGQTDCHAPNTERILSQGYDDRQRQEQPRRGGWREHWYEVATRFCRVDDGVSQRIHGDQKDRSNRLKSLGNAIVPQVAEQIFRAIKEIDKQL